MTIFIILLFIIYVLSPSILLSLASKYGPYPIVEARQWNLFSYHNIVGFDLWLFFIIGLPTTIFSSISAFIKNRYISFFVCFLGPLLQFLWLFYQIRHGQGPESDVPEGSPFKSRLGASLVYNLPICLFSCLWCFSLRTYIFRNHTRIHLSPKKSVR